MPNKTKQQLELEIVKLKQQVISEQTKNNTLRMSITEKHQKEIDRNFRLQEANMELIKENANVKDENQKLHNLLFVLTKDPNQLDKVRELLQTPTVHNSPCNTGD